MSNHRLVTGELTIATSLEWRESLAGCLAAGGEAHVDLSGVERCDVAGLQLLIALGKSAAAQGVSLDLAAVPPDVQNLAALLGVALPAGKGTDNGV